MTEAEHIILETLVDIQNLFKRKAAEYKNSDDTFHNFNIAAKISGKHPTECLDGMLMKHYVSYRDLLEKIKKEEQISIEVIEEKFNDILLYFLLQKALFIESCR